MFLLICSFSFFACSAFSAEKVPYNIEGNLEMDESEDYEIAGLNLYFYNRSERTVKEFTIVFYVFDADGEPASFCRSNISFSVKKTIPAQEAIDVCLSLDSFFIYVPDEYCTADYMYVSRILYEDGSVWQDPFGLALL